VRELLEIGKMLKEGGSPSAFSFFSVTGISFSIDGDYVYVETAVSDDCNLHIELLSDVSNNVAAGNTTDWASGELITSVMAPVKSVPGGFSDKQIVEVYIGDTRGKFVAVAYLKDNKGRTLSEPHTFIENTRA
jgi:hypothetical protein